MDPEKKTPPPPKPRVGLSPARRQLLFDLRLAASNKVQARRKGLKNLQLRAFAPAKDGSPDPSKPRRDSVARLLKRLNALTQFRRRETRGEAGPGVDLGITEDRLIVLHASPRDIVQAIVDRKANVADLYDVEPAVTGSETEANSRGARWATPAQLAASKKHRRLYPEAYKKRGRPRKNE